MARSRRKRAGIDRAQVAWVGLVAGPLLALFCYAILPSSYPAENGASVPFSAAGRWTAATAVWMAVWWMTEAIPVPATALLPILVFPLVGAAAIREATTPYAHELIFLFMGGFILALAMERWGLHRRLALLALRGVGSRPTSIVGGFMAVTAALSMWVSNTATVVMMLPLATSVREWLREAAPSGHAPHNLGRCLLLGIAYSASIGGIGTLIGTPPNLFLASFLANEMKQELSFVRWMGIALPLVVTLLPLTWFLLTRLVYPLSREPLEGGRAQSVAAYRALGPMTRGEWITLSVFVVTALLWVFRPVITKLSVAGMHPLSGLTDPGIAMLAALTLFVLPVERQRRVFAMDWETALRLPWGILVLFGGGLSLAAAIQRNGVAALLGHHVAGLSGAPAWLVILGVTALMIFLTEITSNTATTATMVPILAALAPGLGVDPLLLLIPATMAASCAFMLPVATPPNAVVFGSGLVTIPEMARAGLWLNLLGIAAITSLSYLVVLPLVR